MLDDIILKQSGSTQSPPLDKEDLKPQNGKILMGGKRRNSRRNTIQNTCHLPRGRDPTVHKITERGSDEGEGKETVLLAYHIWKNRHMFHSFWVLFLIRHHCNVTLELSPQIDIICGFGTWVLNIKGAKFHHFHQQQLSLSLSLSKRVVYSSGGLMEVERRQEKHQTSMKSRFRRVCVFCGSSPGKNPSYQVAAIQLGKQLVERKIDLVYGGGSIGLMGLVSQAVYDGGRHVLGVIPRSLMHREITGESIGEVRPVSGMHQRKAEMGRQADAFIALPGGYGTLEELLEVLTWAQLGIHEKPVGLLNVDGYYNSLLSFLDKAVEEGFITPAARNITVSAQTAHELISKLEGYVPKHPPAATTLRWEIEQHMDYAAKSDIAR